MVYHTIYSRSNCLKYVDMLETYSLKRETKKEIEKILHLALLKQSKSEVNLRIK